MVVEVATAPPVEANGLHSPPDSNMKDASDSELSDLEDEQPAERPAEQPAPASDDIGEIEPSYYSNDGVPVFVPSMHQFKNFTLFVSCIRLEDVPLVGHRAKKNHRCTKSTNTA